MISAPPKDLAKIPLRCVTLNAAELVRISRYQTGEPHFGKSGASRFDAPLKQRSRFGTCYFGQTLLVAFAETVLHDAVPHKGKFEVTESELASRFVVSFSGDDLQLADLTGSSLKALGSTGALSTVIPYDLPQQWSAAVHKHPQQVDGIRYMSRHINTEPAVVLFDRAASKINAVRYTPLLDAPGALRVFLECRCIC